MTEPETMEIKEKIKKFIGENLTVLEEDVDLRDDDNIFELGFVDSLFAMQLVGFVEETFQIQVTNQDLDLANFSSVDKIVSFIDNKIQG
jgi:acyl carrier protein